MDFGFFLRPFVRTAWLATLSIAVIVLTLQNLPADHSTNDSNYVSIIVAAGGLAATVLQAYYGGAMTMFFTSEPTVPFHSLEEVFAAMPEWSLKFFQGYQASFLVHAETLIEREMPGADVWNDNGDL